MMNKKQVDPKQLNSIVLAYIGDAIYEVYVRQHLIESGQINPHELHQRAVKFVAATGQAQVIHQWLNNGMLTEVEEAVVRRGRNAKSNSVPKNASIQDYRYATGFEALIGYLHLGKEQERLEQLMIDAIMFIEHEQKGMDCKWRKK